MYELALFAGSGGGILGGHLCGFTCIGAVEIEEYPREVLKQRQRDGVLPEFPIWDDVTTFRIDNLECREYIELLREHRENLIITGGFPCQDISAAGKGAGIAKDTRSGLWFEFARIIDEIRPARVLVENSPVLTSRGLGIVLGDLAEMGYNARWGVLGAVDVGAPHKRERIWIMANSNKKRCFSRTNESKKEFKEIGRSKPCFGRNSLADANSSGCERKNLSQSKERNKKTKLIRSGAVSNATGERLQEKRPKQQTARTTRDGSFRSMADTAGEGLQVGRRSKREESEPEKGTGLVNEFERCSQDVSNSNKEGLERGEKIRNLEKGGQKRDKFPTGCNQRNEQENWTTEPELGRVANELADKMDGSKTNE